MFDPNFDWDMFFALQYRANADGLRRDAPAYIADVAVAEASAAFFENVVMARAGAEVEKC